MHGKHICSACCIPQSGGGHRVGSLPPEEETPGWTVTFAPRRVRMRVGVPSLTPAGTRDPVTRTCALRDHPAGTRIHRAQDTGPHPDLCQSRRGHLREPTCTHRVGVIKNHILPAPTAAGGTRVVTTCPRKREDPGVPAPACRQVRSCSHAEVPADTLPHLPKTRASTPTCQGSPHPR